MQTSIPYTFSSLFRTPAWSRHLGNALSVCATLTLAAACGDSSDDDPAPAMEAGYTGVTRTHYIAADEVEWDYAPDGFNMMTGQPFTADEGVFVTGNGTTRIGSKYKKAIYREYTDKTFSKLKDKTPPNGLLGPVLHAVVGDKLKVVFRNNSEEFPYSVHPHGVFYEKDAEGAGGNDGTSGADLRDDAVPPGETFTYEWKVPQRSGPGPTDQSSTVWLYHSHVGTGIADEYSGLVGAIVVTDPLFATSSGAPADVDQEVFSLYMVIDENQSNYLAENIAQFAPDVLVKGEDAGAQVEVLEEEAEEFEESNLMHSINGYVYANGPMTEIKVGERVRWNLMALGTEVDLHTPHWHGNTVVSSSGHRTDVVELLPASMVVADMIPDDPGMWMFHCHVNDHISAGMIAMYNVSK